MPREWYAEQQRVIKEPTVAGALAIHEARERKDWARVLRLADERISRMPTLYSSYWDRAEALLKLGRKKEAVPALEVFVRYCKDEMEHPDAVQLLSELKR